MDALAEYQRGIALAQQRRLDEALVALRNARSLAPASASAHLALGSVLAQVGQIDEAVAIFRAGMRVAPDDLTLARNYLFGLQFLDNISPQQMLAEHRAFDERFAAPLAESIRPHENDRDADRRLRIGYVSPCFCDHVQRLFMVPLLRAHDRANFEIVCFSHAAAPDGWTDLVRSLAHEWCDVSRLSDAQAADQIRAQRIDIAVDLTMHMANARPLIFAHKPAPVQIAWLAYPGTTGLRTIDYRLSDPRLDPPGTQSGKYSEQTILLPDSFWCFDPMTDEPLSASPALHLTANDHVTFGCLNAIHKASDRAILIWANVMRAVPKSRFIMMAPAGSARQRVIDRFARGGVDASRIEFVEFQSRDQYLRTFHRIDIALDTVPYNGHTTSLDALFMGVPPVTLVGDSVVGRAGLSQLYHLELTELVARDDAQFVEIARSLAGDLPRLAELRRTLRDRMKASPLMDINRFARGIESAYRDAWRRWCAQCRA